MAVVKGFPSNSEIIETPTVEVHHVAPTVLDTTPVFPACTMIRIQAQKFGKSVDLSESFLKAVNDVERPSISETKCIPMVGNVMLDERNLFHSR